MTELTVERLFSDPPLAGTIPSSPKFSPDSKRLAFIAISEQDRERTNLWCMDVSGGVPSLWLDTANTTSSSDAASANETEEEKAERERKRIFSTGVSDYHWHPDSNRVLIPMAGQGFLLEVGAKELVCMTPANTRQTDFAFSPSGRFVTYVRAQNIYCYDLHQETESKLTHDGGDTISNGLAGFLAAEEMHRFEGYWWSPCERFIAFTQVDESPIPLSHRYDINADSFRVIEQRYPYTGGANALVKLGLMSVESKETTWLTTANDSEAYLARVQWLGDDLLIQVQSRNQQQLELKYNTPTEGKMAWQPLLTETSASWVNLHDNLLGTNAQTFFWTSERNDYAHLYQFSDGMLTQLTQGECRVNSVLAVVNQTIYFTGWLDDATEQHLLSISLIDGVVSGEITQVTDTPGWHEIALSSDGAYFADATSNLNTPTHLALVDLASRSTRELGAKELSANHPYSPFLQAHQTPVLGTLAADDGTRLHYRLTQPTQVKGQHPVIVYVYGGPGVHRVRNEWPPLLLQLFAQAGFGVLELDNRGSSNRCRSFESHIYRQLGEVEVRDQIAGAKMLAQHDWVDTNKIGVFGHSYGGYMTLMCLAKATDYFAAGVSVAPVTDWMLYDTHYTERYLWTPQDNPEGYQRSGVFEVAKHINKPLLLIHGMADDNVLYTNSTKLYRLLQSENIPFEMMAYPGSKHALQERDVSIHRFTLLLNFFSRHLK